MKLELALDPAPFVRSNQTLVGILNGVQRTVEAVAPEFQELAHLAVRKGGTLSILGFYGLTDKFPLGVLMNKGVTVRTAQQHGQAYVDRLLEYTTWRADPSRARYPPVLAEGEPEGI